MAVQRKTTPFLCSIAGGQETAVRRWRFCSTDRSIARSTRSVLRILGLLDPQPDRPAPAATTAIRPRAGARTPASKSDAADRIVSGWRRRKVRPDGVAPTPPEAHRPLRAGGRTDAARAGAGH